MGSRSNEPLHFNSRHHNGQVVSVWRQTVCTLFKSSVTKLKSSKPDGLSRAVNQNVQSGMLEMNVAFEFLEKFFEVPERRNKFWVSSLFLMKK